MATIATPVFEEYAGGTIARAQVGLWRDGFRRLRRNRLALVAVALVIVLVLAKRDFDREMRPLLGLARTERPAMWQFRDVVGDKA